MAIKTFCDECEKEIPADRRTYTLRISGATTGDILDMDLCKGCARHYLGVLRGTNTSDVKVKE